MSDELNHILQELTALNRHENAKVALRARQVSCNHTECDESASFFLKKNDDKTAAPENRLPHESMDTICLVYSPCK